MTNFSSNEPLLPDSFQPTKGFKLDNTPQTATDKYPTSTIDNYYFIMKFTLTTVAFMATLAIAAPNPQPVPPQHICKQFNLPCYHGENEKSEEKRDAWCERPGQSCWKTKRVAEAESWCERPGQSCWKVKRAAEAFADAEAEAMAWCERPGQSCWKSKRDAAPEAEAWCERPGQSCWKAKRFADADAWCERPGQSCWKVKRAAEALADAEADAWCERPGQSCWKAKRDAEAEADANPQEAEWCERPGQPCFKAKREAEAEAWCERPGQSCWKVKRAAEAFAGSFSEAQSLEARSPEAELSHLPGGSSFKAKRVVNDLAHIVALTKNSPDAFYNDLSLESHFARDTDSAVKRNALPAPWCERPGQSCWKRDAEADAEAISEDKRWCERPGQSCWKAKRAAEAVLGATGPVEARNLDERSFDPEFAKREADAWCERPGQSCWKRDAEAEAWCERPGQSCWKAKRDLDAMRLAARDVLSTLQ